MIWVHGCGPEWSTIPDWSKLQMIDNSMIKLSPTCGKQRRIPSELMSSDSEVGCAFRKQQTFTLKVWIILASVTCCRFWMSVRILRAAKWIDHLGLIDAPKLFPLFPLALQSFLIQLAATVRGLLRGPYIKRTETVKFPFGRDEICTHRVCRFIRPSRFLSGSSAFDIYFPLFVVF